MKYYKVKKTEETVKSSSGKFELATPRDREGNFEPQIVKKHQTTISDEIEEKILSMYVLGMSYRERPFIIPCQLRKLYHRFKASSNLPSKKIAS
ncbi:MAG: transposase [Nautiliaceae bacterium]|jgi:transposase-like protein